jgi:hypothetical protein
MGMRHESLERLGHGATFAGGFRLSSFPEPLETKARLIAAARGAQANAPHEGEQRRS